MKMVSLSDFLTFISKEKFLLTVLSVAIFSIIYTQREALIKTLPASQALFASIGISTNLVGFDFKHVQTKQEVIDGQVLLSVNGQIVNVSNIPSSVPIVQINLLDKQRQSVYQWTVEPEADNLYPNGQTRFMTKLASPPIETKEVRVKFLTKNE